jgi:DtxR family Mn-dependent transcriptional regulator
VDPHGDPIPSADLTPPGDDDTTPLSDHDEGESVVVARVSDRDDEELRYLADAGITPGTRIEVVDVAPFGMVTVRIGGDATDPDGGQEEREQSLPESVATSIRVRTSSNDGPEPESGVGGA